MCFIIVGGHLHTIVVKLESIDDWIFSVFFISIWFFDQEPKKNYTAKKIKIEWNNRKQNEYEFLGGFFSNLKTTKEHKLKIAQEANHFV